ncbi:MAG: protein-disulfide reductase DsbD N-terminal domain-containing protein [Pseudomonadota bacterium]
MVLLTGLLLAPVAHADLAGLLGDTLQILSPQQAFAPELAAGADGTLELRFVIAPGHYLYRDRLSVTGAKNTALAPALPAGEPYDDAEFGRVLVLRGPQRIPLGVPAEAGVGIDLRYQGCAEGRLCYAPVRAHLQLP